MVLISNGRNIITEYKQIDNVGFIKNDGWGSFESYPIILGDVNGDGKL